MPLSARTHLRRRPLTGFTLVEVLVVVVVIGILVTLGTLVYTSIQRSVRDSERHADVTIVAEALEKYYETNGEYPSCDNLTGSAATVRTLLPGVQDDALVAPRAASGTANSFVCSDIAALTGDGYAFVGDTSPGCTSGGACGSWTIKYRAEDGGDVKEIKSRHSGVLASAPVTPDPDPGPTAPAAPAQPTITAAQTGTSIVATSSTTACPTGTTARYSFQERIGSGTWSIPTNFETYTTYTRTGNTDGATYWFQVRTRCDLPTIEGNVSPTSNPVSVSYAAPVQTPNAPVPAMLTVSVAKVDSWLNVTSTEATCAIGTPSYRFDSRVGATGSWTVGAWQAERDFIYMGTLTAGTTYYFQVTPRCINGTLTAEGMPSAPASYTEPAASCSPFPWCGWPY